VRIAQAFDKYFDKEQAHHNSIDEEQEPVAIHK